jgi:hypothetical protein
MKRIDIGAVVVRVVRCSREGCVLVVDHAVERSSGRLTSRLVQGSV